MTQFLYGFVSGAVLVVLLVVLSLVTMYWLVGYRNAKIIKQLYKFKEKREDGSTQAV